MQKLREHRRITMRWDNDIYREKFGFKTQQGLELVAQLTPVPGKLLEIGSETGILSYQLWKMGYTVEGIEFDYKLVDMARRTTAKSVFYEGDVDDVLLYEDNYSMAIANDVLHKIPEALQDYFIENVFNSLKVGAELTFNTGAPGNNRQIEDALAKCFADEGLEYPGRFYPEAGKYEQRLTSAGFDVERVVRTENTQQIPGEDGLAWYIEMMYRDVFPKKQDELAERIIANAAEKLTTELFDGDKWTIPQVRLVGKVVKPEQ